MRRLKGHEQERLVSARKVAKDANAWANKLRADAAKRAPAIPQPVSTPKEWKK
jgi:hypothetical protein